MLIWRLLANVRFTVAELHCDLSSRAKRGIWGFAGGGDTSDAGKDLDFSLRSG